MENQIQKFLPLLARIFLSAIFIKAGIDKILDPAGTQDTMTGKGIPLAGILLIPTIIVLVAGGLSVLFGFKARYGALALIGFLIPATLIFHTDFSNRIQEIMFLKNLGLIGGLLMIAAFGAGPLSIDERNTTHNSNPRLG
ncbi:DoxX family protein [Ancylothrix sp. C2]|uniref:DoxX family protein n=1 Tax=Ancylothrix sp. D3o TaxID=2953691 RepID=UPI0021BAAF77|nr:DoxX family protein [Ancylothrix sp. D3o]MCT7951686.1 DoxX family protein [Ancylothrix sp. D3o]